MIGPRLESLTAIAETSSSGEMITSPMRGQDEVEGPLGGELDPVEHRRAQREQRHRLAGLNSARSIRISIVEGATWTVTPRW